MWKYIIVLLACSFIAYVAYAIPCVCVEKYSIIMAVVALFFLALSMRRNIVSYKVENTKALKSRLIVEALIATSFIGGIIYTINQGPGVYFGSSFIFISFYIYALYFLIYIYTWWKTDMAISFLQRTMRTAIYFLSAVMCFFTPMLIETAGSTISCNASCYSQEMPAGLQKMEFDIRNPDNL